MLRYITVRVVYIVPVLLFASMISFGLAKLAPGDITLILLGPYASENDRQALKQELALDQPVYVQYARWLGRALQGDLGRSIEMRAPVSRILADKFKNTLILGFTAFLLAFVCGVGAGILSAVKQTSLTDRSIQVLITFLATMPVFWLGLVLIYVFAINLRLLPTGRMEPVAGGGDLFTLIRHLILPALATAAIPAAIIAKSTRSAVTGVMREDFVLVARAKGLPERVVRLKHVLKAAAPNLLYVSGLQFAYLIGGTVIFTEVIFSWPGIGMQIFNAVASRDVPMIQGIVLLAALVSVITNLVVDLLHPIVDPRVTVSNPEAV
jgi:peptide/nickel transport system permease protein